MARFSREVIELAPLVATSCGSSPSFSRPPRGLIRSSCKSGLMVAIGCNWQKLVCNRSEFVDHYARTAGFVPKKAFKPVQPNPFRLGPRRQARPMAVPSGVKYAIIGAGIHGLSTAYHLALKLKEAGKGSGKDILVIDKTSIAAGASGIACGVVRNNYYQPAMRELMAHSVSVWESDPKAYSYHPVGYMQISPEVMHQQVGTIYEQQKNIGYTSTFVEGEKESTAYMKGLFDDWQAKGITSVLHEKKGGYANNTASIYGLVSKAENEGVRLLSGVKVTGFEKDNKGAVKSVVTDKGKIGCDQVVIAAGPWVKQIWDMLDLPAAIEVKGRDGKLHKDVPMWTF